MSSGKQTERCLMMYTGTYSTLSPLNNIPTPSVAITMFSVQMVTSGIANWFKQHGLQMALSPVTYIISSGMSVFGASVQRMNLEMISLLTSNTHGGITTYTECSAMPTPRQPMPNSHRTRFTVDSTYFDMFPVLWATSRSPTSCI